MLPPPPGLVRSLQKRRCVAAPSVCRRWEEPAGRPGLRHLIWRASDARGPNGAVARWDRRGLVLEHHCCRRSVPLRKPSARAWALFHQHSCMTAVTRVRFWLSPFGACAAAYPPERSDHRERRYLSLHPLALRRQKPRSAVAAQPRIPPVFAEASDDSRVFQQTGAFRVD